MPMVLNMTDQMTALEIVRRANAPEPYKIIELMGLTNEMLLDAPTYEANNATVNVSVQRTIKEIGTHRIYNQGVGSVATQTVPVTDRIAMMAEYSKVDAKMVEHSGNKQAARQSEAVAIIKGMGLTQSKTLVYGDGNKPEEFNGMFIRRNKLNGKNVLDAGGTSNDLDMTSIYLVAFGPDLLHLIYPKGSNSVGVSRRDLDLVDMPDENDPKKMLPMYAEYFEAQYGIAVKEPQALIRLCNIPKDIAPDRLVDLIIDASYELPMGASTYAMYSNKTINKKIDKASRDKNNVAHTTTDPWGRPILNIRDLRCRRMDVISHNEEKVPA
jgi:hypothetical protein